MIQIATMPKKEVFCKEYRKIRAYKGFELSSLKRIVDYSFDGFVLKVEKNNAEFRFDIYLRREHTDDGSDINMKEVEKFRKFYGKGFNVILLSGEDEGYLR